MISRVIQGTDRIPNDSAELIHLSKSKHFAQVRRVTSPTSLHVVQNAPYHPPAAPIYSVIGPVKHSANVIVDPDKLMTPAERNEFLRLLSLYDNVFNKNFGAYNGASGPYKASLGLGPSKPPPTKPMLPLYPQTNLRTPACDQGVHRVHVY